MTLNNTIRGLVVKSRSFRIFIVGGIPLLSAAGGLLGYRLLIFLMHSSEASTGPKAFTDWVQIFATLITILVCCVITLWWTSSYLYFIVQLALFKVKLTTATPRLPAWAPTILKVLVSSSLGLGLIAGPQVAHAATNGDGSHSITQASQKLNPLFSRPGAENLQELPPESQVTNTVNPPEHDISPQAVPLFTGSSNLPQRSIITVSTNSYPSISPLFGGLPAQQEKESEPSSQEGLPARQPVNSYYAVEPGDSLWSIAESRLPAHATGAEVLNLIQEIQRLNNTAIPTLDAFIFPGQQIVLPS